MFEQNYQKSFIISASGINVIKLSFFVAGAMENKSDCLLLACFSRSLNIC
jgi:hypothetical protein